MNALFDKEGRGTYWVLRHDLHHRLSVPGHPERNRCIDWEADKIRVLSILKRRAEKGDPGLQNAEVRQIVHMDRQQVNRLIHKLEEEGQVRIEGHGRGARYSCIGGGKEAYMFPENVSAVSKSIS